MTKKTEENKSELVNALRTADRPVYVAPKEMTQRLVSIRDRKRKIKRIRSTALMVALPVVVLALGFAIKANVDSRSSHELARNLGDSGNAEQSIAKTSDVTEDRYARKLDELRHDIDTILQIESLSLMKSKLEKEIELLQQTELKNKWLMTRELASRDGLSDANQ